MMMLHRNPNALVACVATVLLSAAKLIVVVDGQGRGDPVMAGYDVVAYHSLDPLDDGIPGSDQFQTHHLGYSYYFSSQKNLEEFELNPAKYIPKYGGFCAWGVAWEYEGWPWAANHMGPPCGPRDGWALLTDSNGEKRLYCSIWRSYQNDFNSKQEEGIRLADQRWTEFYGSLDAGPYNNGCYAWNWQECFAESIYDPNGPMPLKEDAERIESPTIPPTQLATLFPDSEADQLTTLWSELTQVLGGALTFQYTLDNVASIRPLLIVDLVYKLDSKEDEEIVLGNQYIGFGVAEQGMQGALIVCFPDSNELEGYVTAAAAISGVDGTTEVASICKTYLGAGMGITEPELDPVMPTVLKSTINATHYHIRFSANLFACWSNPAWPARVLFSRGFVSGNGDPMPHRNTPLHRQAVTGVSFLSVVDYVNMTEGIITLDPKGPPEPLPLEPLPVGRIQQVEGTSGLLNILDGRVTVVYGLYQYGDNVKEDVVHVELKDVPFDPENEDHENTYIGFGFAEDTMSGLVITCAPQAVWKENENENEDGTMLAQELTARCHQWRGFGTNLYPRSPTATDEGWHVTSIDGNGTHVTYSLAGRVQDVVGSGERHLTSTTNLRAIAAIGRAAPDTGTPLMHASSLDRTPLYLNQLSVATTTMNGNTEEKSAGSSAFAALKSPNSLAVGMVAFIFWMVNVLG